MKSPHSPPMDSDHEDIINRMRDLVEHLRPKAEALREEGVDVDEFLEGADGFLAALEGRYDGEFDVPGFIAKLTAYAEEIKQRDHLLKQAEAVRLVEQLPRTPEILDEMAKDLRESGSEDSLRMAAEMAATADAVRERLAEGVIPVSELQGLTLSVSAEIAEVNRRVLYRSIAMARFFETRPPEWWAELTDPARESAGKLLESWKIEREELLGQLPLADRRRLEEARMEDFDAPEVWKP